MTTAIELAQSTEALALSQRLAKSGLVPSALRNKPDDILVILLTGQELGIGPMMALRSMNVIEGKPVMSAALMVGLCLKHQDICEYFRLVESTDKLATYETKRRGSEPATLTWTLEQAEKAKLTNKNNWLQYPAAMLRARCSADLARSTYQDLVANIYDPDEAEDFKVPEPKLVSEPTVVREIEDPATGQVAIIEDRPSPAVEVLAPFGKQKNLPLSKLNQGNLDWLESVVAEGLDDPAKARFKAKNSELLAAIRAEQSRRKAPVTKPAPNPLDSKIPF